MIYLFMEYIGRYKNQGFFLLATWNL